jgi:hypothetical protein
MIVSVHCSSNVWIQLTVFELERLHDGYLRVQTLDEEDKGHCHFYCCYSV